MNPLWLLFGFLLGWVVAQVQERARRQALQSQLQELQSRLDLEKVKARERHLAQGWDLEKG